MIAQILSGGRIRMLGISLLFGFFAVMVPDYVYAGSDTDIRFSRESGFYEESFYLEITGGGAKRESDTLLYVGRKHAGHGVTAVYRTDSDGRCQL